MYTMCKTYGIQTTRGMAWVVEIERKLGYNEGCKSTDEGGEPRCLMCASTNVPKITFILMNGLVKSSVLKLSFSTEKCTMFTR